MREKSQIIQGVFNSPPPKMSDYILNPKQKSYKCQNLFTSWHLELLGGGLKNTLCHNLFLNISL